MIVPDLSQFRKWTRQGNLIAVSKTLSADLETPVSCFLKLEKNEEHAFLLESAEQEEKIGRYSFIGFAPKIVLRGYGPQTDVVTGASEKKIRLDKPVLEVIQKILASYRFANRRDYRHLSAGLVGYLGYENVAQFEAVSLTPKKGPNLPDSIFFLPENLVVFDHFRKTLSLIVFVRTDRGAKPETVYRRAVANIQRLTQRLRQPLKAAPAGKSRKRAPRPKPNMTPAEFRKKVRRIKAYIRAGDCIQVVLSQRLSLPGVTHDFQIYRALRSINPSPYMFYFRSGSHRLIGSSPEMLVKKTGARVELRPIAGTRPRGRDSKEDAALEDNLKRSVKETAEHVMLVDLGRNDLGRVCQFESVKVSHYARVERYSHVMHLVSDVAGTLRRGKTAFDLLKATFPAGTLSGAPKIRAMQIIDELEPERRGPYGGCLGYFNFDGDMDMCIVIRTLVCDGRRIYLQAGAGIVKDSDPRKEYAETMNKARALLRAVEHHGDFACCL